MLLFQQKISLGLSALAAPGKQGVTGTPRIGNQAIGGSVFEGPLLRQYPLMTAIGAVKIVSAAAANVATLTLGTGAVARSTGSPRINGLDAAYAGTDYRGESPHAVSALAGIRLRTKSTNTGTIAIAGSAAGIVPAVTLSADTDLVLALPADGLATTGTVTFTFSAASDEVWVEYLGLAQDPAAPSGALPADAFQQPLADGDEGYWRFAGDGYFLEPL